MGRGRRAADARRLPGRHRHRLQPAGAPVRLPPQQHRRPVDRPGRREPHEAVRAGGARLVRRPVPGPGRRPLGLPHLRRHRGQPLRPLPGPGPASRGAGLPLRRRPLLAAQVRRHPRPGFRWWSGVPLALAAGRPTLRLDASVDSISVSGYKFLGTPVPCGVVLTRRTLQQQLAPYANYTGTVDTTISGSRSGHSALLLWYAIRSLGHDGLRQRAERARELAAYAVARLNEVGWPAWRHEHAFTVVFPTPPPAVTAKWVLASSAGRSHLICMPGVTREAVDDFVSDVAAGGPRLDAVPRHPELVR
ncbi:hypothetical protein F8274_09870 [Micromonospora sp. AMSO31t]|nr:hypothetical protein F8274_09870 [Micromonospora sp. AMSO31t]